MDALKQKYGNESPEDRQKREKTMVLPNIFTLALCISMLVIGLQYDDPKLCQGSVQWDIAQNCLQIISIL